MASADQLAQQLRYGPKVAGLQRRSQYLEDALRALGESGGQNIRSAPELGAKLLATAILKRSSDKAMDRTLQAVASAKAERAARLIAGLPEIKPQPVMPPSQMAAPQPPPAQQAPPQQTPAPQPPMQPQPSAYSPQDRDSLIRMLVTEAGGEGPEGMAAAGSVALNRLKSGYGGAKSLRDVVFAPNQFEGMSRANQVRPEEYQRAAQVADALLSGQAQDPTGGAINFLNPELQVQMGRNIPAWAQGQGQRIGRHVFFGGQPQQMAQQGAQAPQMPPQQAQQPFDVAQMGAGANPFPEAPAQPQAPPQAPQQAPQSTTYQPTAQEVLYVRRLLGSSEPEEQARGEAAYWKLIEKMTQAVEWETTNVNGVPAQVNKTTGELRMLSVPEGAQTQLVPTPQGMTPGTVAQRKPTGEYSVLQAPPAGFQGPPQQQSYIQGGPQDPNAGLNLMAGEEKLRGEYDKGLKEYTAAREGYGKVVAAAKTGTPAGDIALIFGLMKTLDPTSTVREGEFATVQNSGTVDQTVANIYNRLLTGEGSLTPAQRSQYADTARRQFEVYQRTADSLGERYGGLAKSYGYDPSRVVRQFDPIAPYTSPTPQGPQFPAAVNQAHQLMVQRGEYKADAPLGDRRRPFLAQDAAALQAVDIPANKGKWVIGPDGRKGQID